MKIKSAIIKTIKRELNEMCRADQAMRMSNTWDDNIDKKNTARMKEIVKEFGWPTISVFGKKASGNAWLLVQHADLDVEFQEICLSFMKRLPPSEVSLKNIAYLEDRVLMNSSKPQVYGTQIVRKTEGGNLVYGQHIVDPNYVDKRRAAMGLEPLSEYIASVLKSAPEKFKKELTDKFKKV